MFKIGERKCKGTERKKNMGRTRWRESMYREERRGDRGKVRIKGYNIIVKGMGESEIK